MKLRSLLYHIRIRTNRKMRKGDQNAENMRNETEKAFSVVDQFLISFFVSHLDKETQMIDFFYVMVVKLWRFFL